MKKTRVLYISPTDMRVSNGIAQLQHQLLESACQSFDVVDLLSLGAGNSAAHRWTSERGLRVNLLTGLYPSVARAKNLFWYGFGAIVCSKLRLMDRFHFFLRAPIPRSWIERYDRIICYYPWAHRLLLLERAGDKVIVNTGDVMADRHERIGARRWITLTSTEEARVLRSSQCLAVSDDDVNEFVSLYGVRPERFYFVPPDADQLASIADRDRPARIGFIGAPSYTNEMILRVLSDREFLKAIAASGVELLVAGGICETVDRYVLDSLRNGGARILGKIGSLADFYSEISATVNPTGPSTGVKIKSVETLLTGRGLITTKWGADAHLAASFPDQIHFIEWPVSPITLADVCVRAVRLARPTNQTAARNYIDSSRRTLQRTLLGYPKLDDSRHAHVVAAEA